MSENIQLNVDVDVAAATLEHFHDQKGGNFLLPRLEFDGGQSHLKKNLPYMMVKQKHRFRFVPHKMVNQ